jgi:hypothetical protein
MDVKRDRRRNAQILNAVSCKLHGVTSRQTGDMHARVRTAMRNKRSMPVAYNVADTLTGMIGARKSRKLFII